MFDQPSETTAHTAVRSRLSQADGPVSRPMLAEVADSIDQATQAAWDVATLLREKADEIFGPVPEKGANAERREAHSRQHDIRNRLETLHLAINTAHAQGARLRQL